jgi:hypothetical protein
LKKKNLLALTKVWVICNSKTRADRKKLEAFAATADKNYSETAKQSEVTDIGRAKPKQPPPVEFGW